MYEPSVIATRYVRQHLASRFLNDLMTREALNDCDDLHPEDLMVIAVNIALIEADDLCDLILRGERIRDDRRPFDIWDGRNDDIRDYVSAYYVVS